MRETFFFKLYGFKGHFWNNVYNSGRWHVYISCTKKRKEKYLPCSMAIGNELLQECFPKQERMGIARMKQDKETEGNKA